MVGSEIKAGGDVALSAQTGDVTIQPASIDAAGKIAISAAQGQVAFQSAADSAYHAETHNNSGTLWQTAKDQGQVDETTRYANLQATQGLVISAAARQDTLPLRDRGNAMTEAYRKLKSAVENDKPLPNP